MADDDTTDRQPTTNQPTNAVEPRPTWTPLVAVVAIIALIVLIFAVLTWVQQNT